MSTVGKYVPRQRPVTAMRVLLGITTKGEILAFCPRANVGHAGDDRKDIRWVAVPHNGDLWDRVENDGDWIVQVSPGHYFIKTDTEFNREYVMA